MKKKRWGLNILLIVFVLVFLGSGGYLVHYYMTAQKSQNDLEELSGLKVTTVMKDGSTWEEVETSDGTKISKKYSKLYEKNKDIVGWITIKDTPIDYPVMQTKEDPEYYIHRNYEKKEDKNGLPFLDAGCDVNEAYGNLMVYGHHMKSGMMFAHLLDYQDENFYKRHKIVLFDTLHEERKYEVVAAFYSQIYGEKDDVFKYYNYVGKLSEKQFNTYVKNIKKLSRYDTGVTPKYGEQLLSLVTCAYHTEEGRFVVVARRVDEESTKGDK